MTEEELLRSRRGVEVPCPRCRGWGVIHYGNGSTWRGGMGASAVTIDVCDVCWGSGDAHSPGENLQEWRDREQRLMVESSSRWLRDRLGADISSLRSMLAFLAEEVERLSRKRKVPDGMDEFWFRRAMELFSSVLREFSLPKER